MPDKKRILGELPLSPHFLREATLIFWVQFKECLLLHCKYGQVIFWLKVQNYFRKTGKISLVKLSIWSSPRGTAVFHKPTWVNSSIRQKFKFNPKFHNIYQKNLMLNASPRSTELFVYRSTWFHSDSSRSPCKHSVLFSLLHLVNSLDLHEPISFERTNAENERWFTCFLIFSESEAHSALKLGHRGQDTHCQVLLSSIGYMVS